MAARTLYQDEDSEAYSSADEGGFRGRPACLIGGGIAVFAALAALIGVVVYWNEGAPDSGGSGVGKVNFEVHDEWEGQPSVAGQDTIGADHGPPGAPWTMDEALVVKAKINALIDMRNWKNWMKEQLDTYPCWKYKLDKNGHTNGEKEDCVREGERGTGLDQAKFVRIAFHDCLRYTDGSGGCDGCLDFHGMYQNQVNDGLLNLPFPNTTNNNNLAFTADMLEKIWEDPAFPPNSPVMKKSLKSTGKSRADLWAFAGLVATERAFDNVNKDCADPKHARTPPLALDMGFKCEIGRVQMKFFTGRRDCKPGKQRPYEASKKERHPNPHHNGKMTVRFMRDTFGMNGRQTVAIMGAHGLGNFHYKNTFFKYAWTRKQTWYLNNHYYRNLASFPSKLAWGDGTWHGGPGGKGAKTGWVVRPLYKTQEKGPFEWFHYFEMCPLCYQDSKGRWKNTGEFWKRTPGGNFDKDYCCKKCFEEKVYDEQCVWGYNSPNKFTKDETAIAADMGLVFDFQNDKDGLRPMKCPGMSDKWQTPGGMPDNLGALVRFNTEPRCPPQKIKSAGKTLAEIVEEYANDQDTWVKDFVIALKKMLLNGYSSLTRGPDVIDTDIQCEPRKFNEDTYQGDAKIPKQQSTMYCEKKR